MHVVPHLCAGVHVLVHTEGVIPHLRRERVSERALLLLLILLLILLLLLLLLVLLLLLLLPVLVMLLVTIVRLFLMIMSTVAFACVFISNAAIVHTCHLSASGGPLCC